MPPASRDLPRQILFQPLGLRISVPAGTLLLEAARLAGVDLGAVCGGQGSCGACRVRLVAGSPAPSGPEAVFGLAPAEAAAGWRLACQVRVGGHDLTIEVPAESGLARTFSQVEDLLGHGESGPREGFGLGAAFDLGTTGLASYLVDLPTGRTLAALGCPNPQLAYGEDVISRIALVAREPAAAQRLQRLAAEALEELLRSLCRQADRSPEEVQRLVAVGNPAMTSLLLGLPVAQLGTAPYQPATTAAQEVPARSLGLTAAPGATLWIPPAVAGFVGADHVAMVLATGLHRERGVAVGMDIGTNTEVCLAARGRLWCCSTASGPAFEGARIGCGMRAGSGAVDRIEVVAGELRLRTLDGGPPIGLCGSGVLDAVAALMILGRVDPRGALAGRREGSIELLPAARTGHGRPLLFRRADIQEVQVAKAAMRAGLDLLLREAGVQEDEISRLVLAGAFGTHLGLESACRVGLVPPLPRDRFDRVGNAAGAGARLLLGQARRAAAAALAGSIAYLELAGRADFHEAFADRLLLG